MTASTLIILAFGWLGGFAMFPLFMRLSGLSPAKVNEADPANALADLAITLMKECPDEWQKSEYAAKHPATRIDIWKPWDVGFCHFQTPRGDVKPSRWQRRRIKWAWAAIAARLEERRVREALAEVHDNVVKFRGGKP